MMKFIKKNEKGKNNKGKSIKLEHGKYVKKEKYDEIMKKSKEKKHHIRKMKNFYSGKIKENIEKIKIREQKITKKDKKRIAMVAIIILLIILLYMINATDFIIPTAPKITDGDNKWYKSKVIKVEKNAKSKFGIKYYQYCVKEEETAKNCKWVKTKTKNVKLSKNGKYYVYFRAIDKKKRIGRISNYSYVKIDNNGPSIKSISKRVTSSSAKLRIKSYAKSGIKKYYYKIDDGVFIESNSDSFVFDKLDPNKEYQITVVIEDELGQKKEIIIKINTSVDKDIDIDINQEDNTSDNKETQKEETKPSTNKDEQKNQEQSSSESPKKEETPVVEEVKEIPEISLDEVPLSFEYGSNYKLPSSYKFGKSGGTVNCTVNGKEYKDTSKLGIGKNKIECVASSNTGVSVKVEKEVEVTLNTVEEMSWGGWITMNLYYPEKSTNWQWRLGNESEIRQGEESKWNDYTGPVTVRLTDVENIYIRYEVEKNGESVVVTVPPTGKMLVDIEPDKYELSTGEKAKVKINYQEDADQKQYKINDSEWMNYTGSFDVEEDTLIEARVIKKEKIYDTDGEVVGTKKNINTDSVFIKKKEITAEEFSVKIKSSDNYVKLGDKATITIDSKGSYDQKQYRVNNGEWTDYKDSFKVNANTLIEARIVKKQYDYSTGVAVEYKKYNYDVLYIGESDNTLNVSINPDSSIIDANSTTNINITYDDKTTSKKYRINNGEWKTYAGSIIVGANTLIEAEATGDNKAYGYTSTYINQKIDTMPKGPSTYLEGPIIGVEPESITLSTKISITPQEQARIIYIKIDNGKWQKYTEPIELTKNQSVYAKYIRESDGKESDITSRYINNIKQYQKPYVKIETIPSLYTTTDNIEVKISGSDYEKLEYSYDGVIYYPYTESLTITENKRLYAKGKNKVGETVEYIDITNIGDDAPAYLEPLTLSIYAAPEKNDRLVASTEITIDYDKKATKKYYRLGSGDWIEYTGTFKVEKNTLIQAYETSDNGKGSAIKRIDYLTNGIMEPDIEFEPDDQATESVLVKIVYDQNATMKKYRIGNGDLIDYTEPFKVDENTEIYAYNQNITEEEASSYKEITNIVSPPRVVAIDKGKYFILKLNYPMSSTENTREYKWQQNGTWKKYNTNGMLLIREEYKDEILGKGDNPVVEVEDDNNNIIRFSDDYYIIDKPLNELMENLFMRWDPYTPEKATFKLSTTEPAKKVKVTINYDNEIRDKYYKTVDSDGNESEWKKYTEALTIIKNNIVIYAKGTTNTEIESEISSAKITNIDEENPDIVANADFITPTRELTIQLEATDNLGVNEVGYAQGKKDSEYFEDNGNFIGNKGTFTVKENGIYTIYVSDKVGNTTLKTIEVTNIDKTAPNIKINVLTKSYSSKAAVEIDYGDSSLKQYKIGVNGTYTNYTNQITINSVDVYEMANSDGTITIFAKGMDQAGNEQVVAERIYILDLDVPNKPVINVVGYDYPILTEYGIKSGNTISIVYDNRDDIDNYYSTDGGKTWNPYNGSFKLNSGTIMAKSIKRNSELTVNSSKNISVVAADALPPISFDGDTTTCNNPTGSEGNSDVYFYVDPSMIGSSITIYGYQTGGSSHSYAYAYNSENIQIASFFPRNGVDTIVIPSGTTKIKLGGYRYSSCEVYSTTMPTITNSFVYPKLTLGGMEAAYNTVNISYRKMAVTKQYKIDNGKWLSYSGSIKLPIGSVVYARSIDKNGKIGEVATYTSTLANDALPPIAYDGDTTTCYNPNRNEGFPNYRFDISEEMSGEKFNFYGGSSSNSVTVYFYNNAGTKIGTIFSYGEYWGTIPAGAVKAVIDSYKPSGCEIIYNTRPTINKTYIYPTISMYKMEKPKTLITLNFGKSAVKKQYKIDNSDWLDYNNEQITLKYKSTIYTRSIDKNNKVGIVNTYTTGLADNAVTEEAYDGNYNTSFNVSGGNYKYFETTPDMWGKIFYINYKVTGYHPDTDLYFYDSNLNEISYSRFRSETVTTESALIPVNTKYMRFENGASYHLYLYEIIPAYTQNLTSSYSNTPKEKSFVDEPNITVSDSDKWTISKTVNISYPSGNYTNEYSYDAENWTKYNGALKITGPTTIYARSISGDEVISSSSYQITKIDSLSGEISLNDLPSEIIVGSDYSLPSSYSFNNPSGGEAKCYIDNKEVSSTKDLVIGDYKIQCSANTNAGISISIEKSITVKEKGVDNNEEETSSDKSVESTEPKEFSEETNSEETEGE